MTETLVQARLGRMERLAARHPGRFCWAELACGALGMEDPGWLHRAQDQELCAHDAHQTGTCYCGQIQREEASHE